LIKIRTGSRKETGEKKVKQTLYPMRNELDWGIFLSMYSERDITEATFFHEDELGGEFF
jgi:hypothetical protein